MSAQSSPSGETRRSLLSSLAAELRGIGAPALIALAASDHPVLYTVRGGRRVAVVAAQTRQGWEFLWGASGQVSAHRPDLAARFLLGASPGPLVSPPANPVTRLFARRPQPRRQSRPQSRRPLAPLTAAA